MKRIILSTLEAFFILTIVCGVVMIAVAGVMAIEYMGINRVLGIAITVVIDTIVVLGAVDGISSFLAWLEAE